jgi:hypothetical protein
LSRFCLCSKSIINHQSSIINHELWISIHSASRQRKRN